MKNIRPGLLLLLIFTLSACTPALPAATQTLSVTVPPPTPLPAEATLLPATQAVVPTETLVPTPGSPTETEPSADRVVYKNEDFGLEFQYPAGWFGPDEYVSDQTLRVEVGSDTVYPYGTGPDERVYETMNSYTVVIQYSLNDQNKAWQDVYQTLSGLQDGESVSGARSLTIRVRQIELGNFSGFEYISTLSETAQTEAVYSREVILVDDQSNSLSVMGTPNNVDLSGGADWRAVYQGIDAANQAAFQQIIDSIKISK